MRKGIAFVLAAVAAIASSSSAFAQYPDKPVKLLVPFPAGGPTDALARNLAEGLRIHLTKQIIVENKPGAAANLGTELVANAPADGYTLLFATPGPLSTNISLFAKLNYDPIKSFDPVMLIGNMPNILVANKDLPANNLKELIAYSKEGRNLSFGSSGIGASNHLAGEMIKAEAGVEMLHVPYRGAAPAMNDLIGGQIPLLMTDAFVASSQVNAGTIKAIGVTSKERTPLMPDVPTLAEQGLKGFDNTVYFGILVPKGTPPDIIETINNALVATLAEPAVKSALDKQGIMRAPSTRPEHLAEVMKADIPRMRALIEKLGLPKQ